MERGEVWWADLDPPVGRQPVVLLFRNRVYQVRLAATVALVTSRVRRLPVEVPIGPADGMPRASVINCDEVHTVRISRIDTPITRLSSAKMEAVADAIRLALDMECE